MNAQKTTSKEKVRSGQPYLYRKSGLPSEVYQIRFKEEINHDDLNHALSDSIIRYPYFKVKFMEDKGDFYSVENKMPLKAIHTDELIPLGGIENNFYLISVTHYSNCINVAFHHGLTDGRGIKNFVETLIYHYCRRHYHNTDSIPGIMTIDHQPSVEEYAEPCGKKYAVNRKEIRKIEGLTRKGFTLPETKQSKTSHRRYELRFLQEAYMEVCKKYGASPVLLLSVMMSRAIRLLYPDNTEVINSNFPVDIRNELGISQTYKNCVKSVSLPYGKNEQQMSTDELCCYYKHLLNEQRKPDHCKNEFNKIIMLLDMLNFLPSYEKKRQIMKFLDDLKLDTYLISYIGRFNLGSNTQYIDSIHLFSDCSDGLVMNMTCECGYFYIDLVQDFESEIYLHALAEQFEMEGIPIEISDKIEFCTPCDHLMRDMPAPIIETRESVWKQITACVIETYCKIENCAVDTMNSISDAFVKQFLLKDSETVQEAKQRLNHEQLERMKQQRAFIHSLNHYH